MQNSKNCEIGSNKWKKIILEGANSFGINITNQHLDCFTQYANLLVCWNKKINLTAITDPYEIAIKHFLDSIILIKEINKNQNNYKILDIGTGAGFPGLVLKILSPKSYVTLIDSTQKKINFLKTVIMELNLKNISAKHIRIQDFIKEKNKDTNNEHQFDFITCRAFSSLSQFASFAIPVCAKTGLIAALKGDIKKDELDSVDFIKNTKNENKFELKIKPYTLPYMDSKRTIILIKKII